MTGGRLKAIARPTAFAATFGGQTAAQRSKLSRRFGYCEASSITSNYSELGDSVRTAYFRIIQHLGGRRPEPKAPAAAQQDRLIDPAATSALAARLLEISTMDPQACGYAFETFLKDVLDAHGMSARSSFRLRGEQIDGSLVLGDHAYLVEARWKNTQVDVATLHAFNGKVETKASFSMC